MGIGVKIESEFSAVKCIYLFYFYIKLHFNKPGNALKIYKLNTIKNNLNTSTENN